MGASDEFDRAKLALEHEMQLQNKILGDKKATEAKLEQEIKDLQKKIADAKAAIISAEMGIRNDDGERKKLADQIRNMERELQQKHAKVESMVVEKRNQLKTHGVDIKHHF